MKAEPARFRLGTTRLSWPCGNPNATSPSPEPNTIDPSAFCVIQSLGPPRGPSTAADISGARRGEGDDRPVPRPRPPDVDRHDTLMAGQGREPARPTSRGARRARGEKPYAPFCWSATTTDVDVTAGQAQQGRPRVPDGPARIAARRIEHEELWPTTWCTSRTSRRRTSSPTARSRLRG